MAFTPLTRILLTRFAEKQLRKLPPSIQAAFATWVDAVEREGLGEVRKRPGLHDEPLKGLRKGQRSIRLSRSYRAIYIETISGIEIHVIEVNKHDY